MMASGSQNNTSFQAQKWTNLRAFTVGNTAKDVDGTSSISWTLNEILGASDSSKFYRGDKTWSDTLTSHLVVNGHIEGDAAIIGNRDQWGLDMYARPFAHHATNPSSTNGGNLYYAAGNKDYYNNPRWCFTQYSYTASSTATNGHYENYRLPATAADLTDNATYEIRTSKSSAYTVDNASKLLDSAHSWTATEVYNYMTARVLKAGDTMTGQLYINYNQDVGLNQTGSLIIGSKGGENVALDGNEIMARNNGAASTLYINSEGGNVYIGSGGITSVGTIAVSAGYLKSTANGNTIQIGAQNSGCCHIYNSANIPFAFNRGFLMVNSGDIGSGSYPTGNIIVKSGGRISGNGGNLYIGNSNNANWVLTQDICSHNGTGDTYWSLRITGVAHFKTAYGAVWNDYAEMRNVPKAQIDINRIYDDKDEIERNYPYAGHCVYEIGDGTMELTNARLAKGCKIISDTFGFCIGETEDCCTPIAVTGRVLAYPYENIEEYKNHIGDCVCSGPNGTISIMTLEETIQHPECIVGTISEIPTYTTWRCGNKDTEPIKVNGRIWIYVR